jgi:hypothetical protein
MLLAVRVLLAVAMHNQRLLSFGSPLASGFAMSKSPPGDCVHAGVMGERGWELHDSFLCFN